MGSSPLFSQQDMQGGTQPQTAPAQQSDSLFTPEEIANVGVTDKATISAVRPSTVMGRLANWIDNVTEDVKYGTDLTGIGTVLKKMGAHGVYMGNPEAVGDFMASLPLGLLKANKGGTELAPNIVGGPKGQTWQGVKDLVGGGLQAVSMPAGFVAPEAGAAGHALEEGAEEAPGIISQIVKGEKVAQPGTKIAIQDAARAASKSTGAGVDVAEESPVLKGNRTVVDDHLDALAQKTKSAYKKLDDTVGFDLKELKDKVSTDEYNLKQLGSSDPDKAGRLIEAINENKDRISEATEKLKAAGIDPKAPDALNKSLMAGKEFKKLIVRSTSADGDAVDLDRLVAGSKALRFGKYGDRLSQFMGKDGADKYMTDLDKMQKLGVHAVKMQQVAKWIGIAATGLTTGGVIRGAETLTR